MFVGRETEIKELEKLKQKKTASLVALTGRRRIGKSSLITEFSKKFDHFYELVGLAPEENITNQVQLDNFANQLALQSQIPGLKFNNWLEAFTALSKVSESKNALILIDEISWMGSKDPSFVGTLKIAWDTLFKKNKVILVLCGSVSSWIEDNILNDTDFYGRISWSKKLEELPLCVLGKFWGKNHKKISPREKMEMILVTGGVPKYLEEIVPQDTSIKNLQRLCYSKSGYLFQEFDKIFNDIFNKKAASYKEIVKILSSQKLSPKDLANKANIEYNGAFYKMIEELESAGFIKRDFTWNLDGKNSKLSKLRISDNYIQFYLKYIEPYKNQINKDLYQLSSFNNLQNWDTICGLQFENTILHNTLLILEMTELNINNILQFGSYFQTETKRRKACQIDLLILCKRKILYVFEIKYQMKIGLSVVSEIEEKIKRLANARSYSIRTGLIYMGELSQELKDEDYFDILFNIEDII